MDIKDWVELVVTTIVAATIWAVGGLVAIITWPQVGYNTYWATGLVLLAVMTGLMLLLAPTPDHLHHYLQHRR